ncbi:tetratricopeptide repeat protein [Amycolatopsis sp. NPDC051371]|uniref:tetratricopeptide repeat protein n=1 Tax=Amycolatopsis sp. NPDC051371 TaxID=3155800 RepID=UPI00343F7A79
MSEPAIVATRDDFSRQLVLLREEAGLTVRELARAIGVPASTLGGYFTGAHLPRPGSKAFRDLLRACGVLDAPAVAAWDLALRRARRPGGGRGERSAEAPPEHPAPLAVSTRAPTDRLARQPRVRGRADLLKTLATVLRRTPGAEPAPAVRVLHGLGGSGKSTLALALARQAERQGIRVWWVAAGDPVLFTASVQAVAVDLGIAPEHLRLGSLPDRVWTCLNGYDRPWLLVFDGVDDPLRLALPGGGIADGNGWVRPIESAWGAVVVTTRNRDSRHWTASDERWVQLHAVDPLTPDAGAHVLLELAGDAAGDLAAAQRLSIRLGGLPLALSLAGRYLGEVTAMPPSFADPGDAAGFDDYVNAMDEGKHHELLDGSTAPDGGDRETIGRTWELSLDLLAKAGVPEARRVLRLLSCLRHGPIPIDLLRPDLLAASPLFPGLTARRLWQSIKELANVGLVDRQPTDDDAGESVVLHPLVREVSRRQDDMAGDAAAYLALLAALLSGAVGDLDPKHPSSWARWSALATHCAAPLDLVAEQGPGHVADAVALVEPALAATRYLRAAGHPAKAAEECAAALAAVRRLLDRDDPVVLALRHEQCRSWYDAGRYDQAKHDLHDVLERRRRVLGADHPDTATSAHYLGRVLFDHGLLEHARRYFAEALDARRRVLGERHPDTLTSFNNMAAVHLERGRTTDGEEARRELDIAEEMLREVLKARLEVLGEDHPATLVTYHHLSRVLQARGDLDQAERLVRRLVDVSVRVLGPNHRRTLDARQLSADVRHARGDAAEADELTRQVLHAREQVLGPDHPATLVSRHRLALVLHDLGSVREARDLLAEVVADRERVLGSRHPMTLRASADLAVLEER